MLDRTLVSWDMVPVTILMDTERLQGGITLTVVEEPAEALLLLRLTIGAG